jgi:hypothetical protein
MEHRRGQETAGTDWKAVERGWCLGDEEFRAELLAQVREQRGDHYGEELRQADEAHAQGLVQQELRQRGWTEHELAARTKGDSEKLKIARRLRQETTMTLKWIAQRLHTGSWTYLSNCLGQRRRDTQKNK